MGNKYPLSRTDEIVVQECDDEILIYDLRADRALQLNETSARIWRACDGTKSIEEISRLVGDENVVWLALEQLKKEGLIERSFENLSKFEGLTRREAVKKVGMASLIALPVIAALAVPTAAQAGGSTCGNVTCVNNGDCATQPVGCRTCVNLGANNKVCRP